MIRKKRLAILASCMLLYSGFTSEVCAGEAANADDAELDEIVVTASQFKQISPAKITVITEEDIKAKGAQNAAEAIKDVAGLYVNSNSTRGKKNVQIRGSDADNTKVIVDGVPLSPVGDGKVDLSSIPADNIAKIEVIKGAVPVIYGTDAPGGVIYITTKKAGDKSAQSVTVTTGSNNAETYFASFAGKKGKVSYNFGVKREDTEGYTEHSKLKADYFNGKLCWDLSPRASLTVFGSYSEKKEELPNRIDPVTGEIVANPAKGGVIPAENKYWTQTYNWEYDPLKTSYFGVLYNQKLNDKNDFSLRVYRSKEDSIITARGGWDTLMHDFWNGEVQGYELQHNIKTSPINTITWGYVHETRGFVEQVDGSSESDPSKRPSAHYDYNGSSFYFQDVTHVNSRLSTSLGYRHYSINDHVDIDTKAYVNDEIRATGHADDPVFNVNYALSGKTSLHGSIGSSYRWPNAKERSGPGGIYGQPTLTWRVRENGKWVWYGNGAGPKGMGFVCNNLLPEEVINREIGLAHSINSRLGFDFTFFNKDITNMIKGQGFGVGHTQYYNIPHVDMKGYEVEVNHKIGKRLKGFLNYTYTNAYDPLLDMQVRDIPYRKYSYGLSYKGEDGINANLAISYVGSCTSAFSNGNGNGDGDKPSEATVQKLPSYRVVDLKVGKEIKNEEYYVKIINLFDEKYYQGAYLVAPGRYIEVGATIKL